MWLIMGLVLSTGVTIFLVLRRRHVLNTGRPLPSRSHELDDLLFKVRQALSAPEAQFRVFRSSALPVFDPANVYSLLANKQLSAATELIAEQFGLKFKKVTVQFGPVDSYRITDRKTAGKIEISDTWDGVLAEITIDAAYIEGGVADIAAILAHELSHVLLTTLDVYELAVYENDWEMERMTDVAVYACGLGKIMLNALTRSSSLGYLSPYEAAYIFTRVCIDEDIAYSHAVEGLTSYAKSLVKEYQRMWKPHSRELTAAPVREAGLYTQEIKHFATVGAELDAAEDQPEIIDQGGAHTDYSLEELKARLGQKNRTEVRQDAAERLHQLGPAATSAIPNLLIAAIDIEECVRDAALRALEAIDPSWQKSPLASKAVPELLNGLKSWSAKVRRAAFGILNSIGADALPEMIDALGKWEDGAGKLELIRLVGRMGPAAASAVPALIELLTSSTPLLRIGAARALAAIGAPAQTAVSTLVVGLNDLNSDVREAMVMCLAKLGAAAAPAVPELLPLLADPESRVREAAASALEAIGPTVVPALVGFIQERSLKRLETRLKEILGLETLAPGLITILQIGDMEQLRVQLRRWLNKTDQDIPLADPQRAARNLQWKFMDMFDELARVEIAQESALRLLGKLGPIASSAVPAISNSLKDPNLRIKLAAIETLGKIGPRAKSAIPSLILMLTDKSERVLEVVATALANIDPEWAAYSGVTDVIGTLAKQLGNAGHSGDLAVRAFTKIGPPSVSALVKVLRSGDRIARQNAARALGQIGIAAGAAIPALTEALQDEQLDVRDEVRKALTHIQRDDRGV